MSHKISPREVREASRATTQQGQALQGVIVLTLEHEELLRAGFLRRLKWLFFGIGPRTIQPPTKAGR